MSARDLIESLQVVSRTFGELAARQKLKLLRAIADSSLSARELVACQSLLNFVRAYCDEPAVRKSADAVVQKIRSWVGTLPLDEPALRNSGLPGSAMRYSYHYGVLKQLLQAWPGSCEIDWQEFEDEAPLLLALGLGVSAFESDGLDDDRLTLRAWLAGCRPRATGSELETAISVIAGAGHAEQVQTHLWDAGDVPIRYTLQNRGQGRCEVVMPGARPCYQRKAIDRGKYPLPPLIREPLPAVRPQPVAAARSLLAIAHSAMCARNLEIYPLIHASPRDVLRVPCNRGIEVVLVGTSPAFRAGLESLYFFLVVKNGVPIAYGPAGVFQGACEMGLNVFPEFRGGEVRYTYGQVMRALHHVLGVDYFYLQSYGMGVGNRDAINTGAFWFYRKLGFLAENAVVEQLAQQEEQRMQEQPGYRSGRKMLHRLKHTRAHLDLSEGRSSCFDFGRLGVQLTQFIGRKYGGDRTRAATRCAAAVAKTLGIDPARQSVGQWRELSIVAPILAMLPDLAGWTPSEKRGLARAIKLRGDGSQAPACRAMAKHTRLRESLRSLTVEA